MNGRWLHGQVQATVFEDYMGVNSHFMTVIHSGDAHTSTEGVTQWGNVNGRSSLKLYTVEKQHKMSQWVSWVTPIISGAVQIYVFLKFPIIYMAFCDWKYMTMCQIGLCAKTFLHDKIIAV